MTDYDYNNYYGFKDFRGGSGGYGGAATDDYDYYSGEVDDYAYYGGAAGGGGPSNSGYVEAVMPRGRGGMGRGGVGGPSLPARGGGTNPPSPHSYILDSR